MHTGNPFSNGQRRSLLYRQGVLQDPTGDGV
jgi:hypothetical protein